MTCRCPDPVVFGCRCPPPGRDRAAAERATAALIRQWDARPGAPLTAAASPAGVIRALDAIETDIRAALARPVTLTRDQAWRAVARLAARRQQ